MASTFLIKLWNDRRGASAFAVMIAMVPLLGMVSLGTELGSWHVIRRHAQSTADAAAIAGATALVVNDPTGAVTAGQAFANSNGFVTGGGCPSTANTGQNVCITLTDSGTGRLTGTRVTAVVTQYETPIFTQWFVPGPVPVRGTAVATIQDNLGGYCALALEKLAISGSSTLNGKCSLASNGTFDPPPPGQNPFLGGPNGWTVSVAPVPPRTNGCTGNANGCNLSGEVQSYNYSARPTLLPPALGHLMNPGVVPAEPAGKISKTCVTGIPSPIIGTPKTSDWLDYYCLPAGATLPSGLYMFRQLDVNGSVSGTGVNIIIGSGGLGGGNGGQMNMTAGTGGGWIEADGSKPMNGVLIFDLEGTPDVKYAGQFNGNFNGALYFPYAHLTFRGGSGLTGCMVVVAKVLDYGGNSSMDTSGCSDSILSSIVPQAQVVMLTN